MKKAIRIKMVWICMGVLIAVLSWSMVWADFYVVASGKKAKKTILVSPKSTETASGTALLNTLNGITDAGETNPYLVIIEPGIYDVGSAPLGIPAFVNIQGAGEFATKIIGSRNGHVLAVLDNTDVRFLKVENTGIGSANSIALSIGPGFSKITHVTAIASGGTTNTAIFIGISVTALNYVTAQASGGTDNYGIEAEFLVWPIMKNITVRVSGGTNNYGIYCHAGADPVMKSINVNVSGGSGSNVAVYNNDNDVVILRIDHSIISSTQFAVFTSSGHTTYISSTRVNGGIGGSGGTNKCAFVYKEDTNNMLNANCTFP